MAKAHLFSAKRQPMSKAEVESIIHEVASCHGIKVGGLHPGWDATRKWHEERVGKVAAIHLRDLTANGWSNFREAVVANGYKPQRARGEGFDDDELLQILAGATRHWKRDPTLAQLQIYLDKIEDGPGGVEPFTRLKKRGERVTLLREWVLRNTDFADILPMLPPESGAKVSRPTAAGAAQPVVERLLSEVYVPPVVADLVAIARRAPEVEAACSARGMSLDVAFEERVAIAFKLLGLDVKRLGQGKGRVPDGVARHLPGHWAVTYDAKAYQGGYSFTANEERKFREYIADGDQRLKNEGIDKQYFALVSASFDHEALSRARELRRETRVIAFPLIQADALLMMIDWRLRSGAAFDLDVIDRLLCETRIVTAELVAAAKS